ncbi:MAG: hypothetical protein PHD96_01210 [Candidatus Pacebacteria bacterium]|jgi:hypothetical protein|nr:hypothetical protein [Candidatus Paceibacterota bacterium]
MKGGQESNTMHICYIGNRNTGKTTRLKKIFLIALARKMEPIIILDSAVEEGNKSLINQLRQEGHQGYYFAFRDKEDINSFKKGFSENKMKSVPFYCDVSYCLERGHEARGLSENKWRNLYKDLVGDIVEVVLSQDWPVPTTPCFILDEIEINERAGQQLLVGLSQIHIALAIHSNFYIASPELLKAMKVVNLVFKYR